MLIYKGYTKGRLIVLEHVSKTLAGRKHWLCKCLCGKTAYVREDNLARDKPTCTACNTKDTHPLTYKSYDAMLQRCCNPNSPDYANYGGRGITVCARWKEDFYYFLEDMGSRLSKSLTLNRLDNSKGYSKENCNWADRQEQAANKRKLNRSFVKGAWQVYLTTDGVSTYMGRYKTEQEADEAIALFKEINGGY